MRSELRQTLKPANRALMTGCYAWWKSDRIKQSPKRAKTRLSLAPQLRRWLSVADVLRQP